MIIVDATNQIVGRMATNVAKLALKGETVVVLNCNKAVVTGTKEDIFQRYLQRIHRGIPLSGPYYPRQSDRIVRRTIRGMLPYKKERGEQALKLVKCYADTPAEMEGKETMQFDAADIKKVKNTGYVYIGEVAKQIGGKR